ncbi:MAG: hypothetical protein MUO26_15495 [Methanotrichaceae archaeon]|nr:hypothetical protein [Methanotrichaceae archaeon]
MTLLKKVMLILCFLTMLFIAQCAQAGWEKLWDGPVGTVVCSSDLGLFATRQDTGDIYRYSPSNQHWEKIGGPAKKFIATKDGLYGLSPDGQGIWKFTGNPEEWIQIGGPASAIYGGGHVLLAMNPDTGDLYLYINPMEWIKIGGPGKKFVVTDSQSRSVVAEKIVGLSPDSNSIWAYGGGYDYTTTWKKIGGPAKEIYSSTSGHGLYATNPETGDLYNYEFPENKWTRIGGPGKMFAANDSGNLFGLSNDGSIVWEYMGVPDDWVQIGGPAKEIYAGCSDLYLVSRGQRNLFRYQGRAAAEVNISSIQYPAAPETLRVAETVPIVVTIEYDNLAKSKLLLRFVYGDPPTYQSSIVVLTPSGTTLSGSDTYQFRPLTYVVDSGPNESLSSSVWPEGINEWHLKAEIWTFHYDSVGHNILDELLTSRAFTLLVEKP